MYIPNFESLVYYYAVFANLFTQREPTPINTTEITVNMSDLALSYYSNDIIDCPLTINPAHQNANSSNLVRPKVLRPIYNCDCRTVYPPEEFIEQYDEYFDEYYESDCQNIAQKLKVVRRIFQSDLNTTCQRILNELPIDYRAVLMKHNEKEIISNAKHIITAYHKIKCLVLNYDYNSNCPTDCNDFIVRVLQHLEHIMCKAKFEHRNKRGMLRFCRLRVKKILNGYTKYGNGALVIQLKIDKYCRNKIKGTRGNTCSIFLEFGSLSCEDSSSSDLLKFTKDLRIPIN